MTTKPAIAETLDSLQRTLVDSLDDNLMSIVHYDSEHAKIQVLIVVKTLENSDWKRISSAFDGLRGRALVEPMLLTKKSLDSSTDIFPILIRQIKKGYRIIHGEDPIEGLAVERSHLRLRCEQELRSLQIRMQGICLMHFASPHRLRQSLVSDYSEFEKLLPVVFELSDRGSMESDAMLQALASDFELDPQVLASAKKFAEGTGEFDEETFGHVYVELMAAVRMAANFVDQLPTA